MAEPVSRCARQRAGRSRLDGMGEGKVSGTACRRALKAGHRARGQRRSERTHGRARVPARAQRGEGQRGRERGEREREWREIKKSPRFDLVQTRDFQLKLEKF